MGDDSFTVLQWNVLARPYTGYNWGGGRPKPHDSVQGHCNTEQLESPAQTAARYGLCVAGLLEQAPDAALLQEVEPAFFEPGVNPGAEALLESYVPYRCFGGARADQPGVVALLRKDGALRKAPGLERVQLKGDGSTGGPSKGTVLVPVVAAAGAGSGGVIWLGSIHMTPPKFNADKARHHLRSTFAAVAEQHQEGTQMMMLAGDFNASPAELDALLAEPALAQTHALARLPLDDGASTGLSSDFSHHEAIDHALLSDGLSAVPVVDGAGTLCAVEKVPASPYAPSAGEPAEVVGASDHVWVKVRVQAAAAAAAAAAAGPPLPPAAGGSASQREAL